MRIQILFIITITALFIAACSQIEVENGPIETGGNITNDTTNTVNITEPITPPSFDNITTEVPKQERGFAPFAIEKVISHGSLFSGSYLTRYKHDYVVLDILVREPFSLNNLHLVSVAKGVVYNGTYESTIGCNVRDMARARSFNKFTIVQRTNITEDLIAGQRIQLCVPTPITMIRGESFSLNAFIASKQVYAMTFNYPATMQSIVLEFDETISKIIDVVANSTIEQ